MLIANINITDNFGKTPLDIAEEQGCDEIIRLLKGGYILPGGLKLLVGKVKERKQQVQSWNSWLLGLKN